MKCLSTGEVGKEEREGRRRAKGGIKGKGASVSGRVKRHDTWRASSSFFLFLFLSHAMNRQPSIISHQSPIPRARTGGTTSSQLPTPNM